MPTARAPAHYDVEAVRQMLLTASDESVFLERARILVRAEAETRGLPPGVRQGRLLQALCRGISVPVAPTDVFLTRLREDVPCGDAAWVEAHPELFTAAGWPGVLDSAGLWIPDWELLLTAGIPGLLANVEARQRAAPAEEQDYLEGVRLSLLAVSELLGRYAAEARRGAAADPSALHLQEAAACCEAVARRPPAGLREALQLFLTFHTVFSCVIGGRDITPGRMDQYLLPFYQADLARGAITPEEATELLAIALLLLSQGSGHIATDFQSVKRTSNRHSHYYVTVGGVRPDGSPAVNALSSLLLAAMRRADYMEPTLCIRYTPDLNRRFWEQAVAAMRDGLPVIAYNDGAVVAALLANGTAIDDARDYATCACMLCFLPGRELPRQRENHNLPAYLLRALTGGRDLLSGEMVGAPTAANPATFDDLLAAFRAQIAFALDRNAEAHRQHDPRRHAQPPLLARPLFRGGLESFDPSAQTVHVEQAVIGLATTLDSLLAIRQLVYRERRLTLDQFVEVLRRDFAGEEELREWLQHRLPGYGCDDREVLGVVAAVARRWVDEVARVAEPRPGVRLRPMFHSWLYNLEHGAQTPATPDGRHAGEPLSSDQTPSPGRAGTPLEALHSMAQLPHDRTPSGGTTLRLSPDHFAGNDGLARLSALIEGYFAEGGLQLHFIFANAETLRDAIAHPEEHQDLLVRVTGFSEHFVRLLPEVQEELLGR